MKVEVFQSDKGDCLLVTGSDGATRVLVDGGMRSSYLEHVAPAMGELAAADAELDLVYVSHIDRDHIAGVLQLMADEVAWRVRDYQHEVAGNTAFPDPDHPRPPAVKRIWHNAFHDVVEDNAGRIQDAIAAGAAVLEGGEDQRELALTQRRLGTSISEGIQLAKRVGPGQLGIPLNEEFGHRLAMVRDTPQTVALGSLALTVIGPFEADLEKLREEWNDWLRNHEAALERLRGRMRADAERLGLGEIERFRNALALRAGELGDRDQVTTPNLASLMLLAEDGGRTLLLTGDGHAGDILKGLEAAGRLDGGGALHLDVLKVQHHGSEHNLDEDFARRVTADHYVFCANGEHENPDLAVVEAIVRSRERDGDGRGFKLWFNCSSRASTSEEGRAHMAKVEALVASLAEESGGRIAFQFLDDSSFEVA